MAALGYNEGKSLSGVDERLADLMQLAAASYDHPGISKVMVKSGHRPGDSRFHGKGDAVDITLYDAKGKPIPDYQSPEHFTAYEKFAQHVRSVQQATYPELDKDLRWGGYFSGKIGKGGKYGAMDLMHFDIGGSRVGMAAGSWKEGLNDTWRKAWGIAGDAGQRLVDQGRRLTATPEGLTNKQRVIFNQVSAELDKHNLPAHTKAAILANINHESRFNPSATNNSGERSFGLFQWNGPRQDALRAYAEANGATADDPSAQVAFFMHELRNGERDAGDLLFSAKTVEEANAAMRQFERYGNGDTEEAKRLKTAMAFAGGDFDSIGGEPSPFGNPDSPSTPSEPKNKTIFGFENPFLDEFGRPRIATALRNAVMNVGGEIKDAFTPDTEKFPEVPVTPLDAKKSLLQSLFPDSVSVPPSRADVIQLPENAPVPSSAPRMIPPTGRDRFGPTDQLPPTGRDRFGPTPQLRPFNPGEQIDNGDGSYSTEVTTTWQTPDGEWVNVPSLWMSPNGPKQFAPEDEAGILKAMTQWESTGNTPFQRYKTVEEATAAAQRRSNNGGVNEPMSERVKVAGQWDGVTSDDLIPDARTKSPKVSLLSALFPDIGPVPTKRPSPLNLPQRGPIPTAKPFGGLLAALFR